MTTIKNRINFILYALGYFNDVSLVRWNKGACEIVINDWKNNDYRAYDNVGEVEKLLDVLTFAATKIEENKAGHRTYFIANNTFTVKYLSNLKGRA